MKGICKTCELASEVFQPAGRTDLICSDCYINVGTAIQLYQTLSEIERAGGDSPELEAQFKLALHRLFGRVQFGAKSRESVLC